MAHDDEDLDYDEISEERDRHTDSILQSDALRKVVVAGLGTGKTTLFAKMLTLQRGDTLTLSFINALVNELALDLYGLSNVQTLHGFSAGVLRKTTGAKIYPNLPKIIKEDAAILLGEEDINFDKLFWGYEDDEKSIGFYKERKEYYGNYYGFSDAIYAVAKFYDTHRDKIPKFEQIVVDEFQDFNNSEVKLIELLAEVSPILLAGDDDQSLYIDLKNASPEHIREKYHDSASGYEGFTLPYCSRSTRVIVEAANDIAKNAIEHGLLKGREKKSYHYFRCEKKDIESAKHPKVVYVHKYEAAMPYFVQKEISEIINYERQKFNVLVIVPPQIGKRLLLKWYKVLKKKGFRNVTYPARLTSGGPTLLDGLKILLDNKEDNLGYRIAAKHLLDEVKFKEILQKCTGTAKVSDLFSANDNKK
jgi:ATP-dependent DNA helicase UvrD/PcrA